MASAATMASVAMTAAAVALGGEVDLKFGLGSFQKRRGPNKHGSVHEIQSRVYGARYIPEVLVRLRNSRAFVARAQNLLQVQRNGNTSFPQI